MTTVITVCMRMIRSKPSTPPATTSAGDHEQGDDLGGRRRRPSRAGSNTVAVASVASEVSTVSQPTVSTQDSSGGHPAAGDAERRPAEHQRRRGAALAGDRDEPAEQEADDDPDDPGDGRLPERDAEAQRERAVGQAQHADVGAEPGPEELPRACPCARHSAITLMPLVSTATRGAAAAAGAPGSPVTWCAMPCSVLAGGPPRAPLSWRDPKRPGRHIGGPRADASTADASAR